MIISGNIEKSFGELPVLRDVNLHVRRGRIYGLAGRSGAGKSTFLRCINGLEPYDGGTMLVDGVEVNSLRENDLRAFRKNVGMIFQNFSLLERLTVYENIALPLKCWKGKTSVIDRKVKELLGLVGLSEKIAQKPRTLSGGQKQRVAIARALSLDPQILLCDEATSALDPNTAQEILSLLRRINNQLGLTIVMVTHQMSVLASTCDEMAILENGRVASHGLVKHIFAEQPPALRNLVGEDCDLRQNNGQTAMLSLHSGPEQAAQMVVDLGIEITIVGGQAAGSGLQLRLSATEYAMVADYLNNRRLVWHPSSPMKADFPSGNSGKEQ